MPSVMDITPFAGPLVCERSSPHSRQGTNSSTIFASIRVRSHLCAQNVANPLAGERTCAYTGEFIAARNLSRAPTPAVRGDFQTHLIAKSIRLSTLVKSHTFANSLAATNAIRIPALYVSMPWRIILPPPSHKPIKKLYKQYSNVKGLSGVSGRREFPSGMDTIIYFFFNISEDTSRHKFSSTCCCCSMLLLLLFQIFILTIASGE